MDPKRLLRDNLAPALLSCASFVLIVLITLVLLYAAYLAHTA